MINFGRRKFRNAPNEMLSESTGELGDLGQHLGEWCPGEIEYMDGPIGLGQYRPNPEATLVCSLIEPKFVFEKGAAYHMPVLDLDIEHVYYPSSTPGHAALLLNVQLPDDLHWKLIEVLEECGIIEPGFAEASRQRGYAAVRTPWTKKPKPATPCPSAVMGGEHSVEDCIAGQIAAGALPPC